MLLNIQNDLQILLYRYLSCQADTRAGEEQGPELAVSLMGLSQVQQLSPSQHSSQVYSDTGHGRHESQPGGGHPHLPGGPGA